ADLGFADRLSHVSLSIHQSLYYDETAAACHWHVPESHYLESWGDVWAYDGTVSIVQPLIVPLYQSRTSYELMSAVLGDPSRSNYDIVFARWQKQHQCADFEHFWSGAVRTGIVPGTAALPVSVTANPQPAPQTCKP